MERYCVLFVFVWNSSLTSVSPMRRGSYWIWTLSSRDSWYILRENSSIRTDRLLLFNFGNRVFCFLLFLSRLRDWPILKSEENRDDFVWCCKLSTIWCDFGGWNRSSVHPRWLDIADKWSKFFRCRIGWLTSDLESHGAVTTDTTHFVVAPWDCIDERLCECILTNRFRNSASVAWISISAQM